MQLTDGRVINADITTVWAVHLDAGVLKIYVSGGVAMRGTYDHSRTGTKEGWSKRLVS